jgi:hypothetical protein
MIRPTWKFKECQGNREFTKNAVLSMLFIKKSTSENRGNARL